MSDVQKLAGLRVAGAQVSGAALSSDAQTTVGSGTALNPAHVIGVGGMPNSPSLSALEKTAQVVAQVAGQVGQPITPSGHLAKADALATSIVAGLLGPAGATPFDIAEYNVLGLLIALAGVWATITDDAEPLTAGAIYYLSDAVAGNLTKTAPTTPGHYVVPVGIALTETTMLRFPSLPTVVVG